MKLIIDIPKEVDDLMEKELEKVKIEAEVSPQSFPNAQPVVPPKDIEEFYKNIIILAIKMRLLQRKQKELDNEKNLNIRREAELLDNFEFNVSKS